MKKQSLVINTIRWVVGILFIVSGLLKANDPAGFSYKMQEFFEAWGMMFLHDYALLFAITMNVFEILAGVALIIGWRMKLFSWLLLLLMLFFTFTTAYVLWSGKIKACGCFGDCVPLKPIQTFSKDIVLLVLIFILFVSAKKIQPLFNVFFSVTILAITIGSACYLQYHVLQHLPLVDCLPYKKGNNLLEQMQMPKGAIPDSFAIVYKYQKDGKVLEFEADKFPENLDSTYEYIDRYDKLVRKGNDATPAIVDFSLSTLNWVDTTQAILQQQGKYILVLVQNFDNWGKASGAYASVKQHAIQKNIPVFIVTPFPGNAPQSEHIFIGDATIVKTAARTCPTFFLMQQANVLEKKSYKDVEEIVQKM